MTVGVNEKMSKSFTSSVCTLGFKTLDPTPILSITQTVFLLNNVQSEPLRANSLPKGRIHIATWHMNKPLITADMKLRKHVNE